MLFVSIENIRGVSEKPGMPCESNDQILQLFNTQSPKKMFTGEISNIRIADHFLLSLK